MIILLSPSKKQSESGAPIIFDSTQPLGIDKALFLMKKLKALSVSEISKIMNLSDSLAKNTYQDGQECPHPRKCTMSSITV